VGEPVALLADSFASDLAAWRSVTLPGRTGPGPALERVHEDGRDLARLGGAHGGIHRVLAVRPSTPYALTGELRDNGLDVAEASFQGASFWIAEARAASSFEELGADPELLLGTWVSASARGTSGWQAREHLFVTHPETRVLHVVCSLAGTETVRAGSVDFAALRLEELPPARLWRALLAREIAARDGIDPPADGWRRARSVRALVGAEHRPSIVLLPGDHLRLALPRLAPGAVLEAGLGPWLPPPLRPSAGSARLTLRWGQRVREVALELGAECSAAAWQPIGGFALGAGPDELELALEGDAPLVLGAPLVRTDAPRAAGANVLLVSIDTLRADHVGALGYPHGTTPTLDALARAGLLCRDVSAPAPYTLPSHATLMTGQFPSVHGVIDREWTLGHQRSRVLAETLAEAGYATQAFTASGFLRASFGFDRGFDGYAEIDPIRGPDTGYFRARVRQHGAEVAARLLDAHGFEGVRRWLSAHADQRFFLFLHTYTVHDYDAPEEFLVCESRGCAAPEVPLRTRTAEEAEACTAEMRAHVVHNYDAALRYTDARLGALLTHLETLGLADETLVVVTSDHGEEFFEHGHLQHGRTLYEELLRIPLIVRGPGVPARVLERPVMLVDVVPTLLARLGLPPEPRAQGYDLLGRSWPARPIWSEVDDRFAHVYALRDEQGRKTIHGPPSARMFPNARAWEHYDLARDPRELEDLAAAGGLAPERRAALEELRRTLEELGASYGASAHGVVSDEAARDLEDLGYGE
jgi:arylsulfatase A-like enzyme